MKIIDLRCFLPGKPISSQELALNYDVNPRLVESFIGSTSRHFAADQSNAPSYDFSAEAAKVVRGMLDDNAVKREELSRVYLSTRFPDWLEPSLIRKVLVEARIGSVPGMQLHAGYAGPFRILDLIRNANCDGRCCVLAICGDFHSKILDLAPSASRTHDDLLDLFHYGDAITAVLACRDSDMRGYQIVGMDISELDADLPSYREVRMPSTREPLDVSKPPAAAYDAIDEAVVASLEEAFYGALTRNRWQMEQIGYVLLPEMSSTIQHGLASRLNVPAEKIISYLDETSYIGNAGLFYQLERARARLRAGERVLALGADASDRTIASAAFIYGG